MQPDALRGKAIGPPRELGVGPCRELFDRRLVAHRQQGPQFDEVFACRRKDLCRCTEAAGSATAVAAPWWKSSKVAASCVELCRLQLVARGEVVQATGFVEAPHAYRPFDGR
jgi:hypothetical protein